MPDSVSMKCCIQTPTGSTASQDRDAAARNRSAPQVRHRVPGQSKSGFRHLPFTIHQIPAGVGGDALTGSHVVGSGRIEQRELPILRMPRALHHPTHPRYSGSVWELPSSRLEIDAVNILAQNQLAVGMEALNDVTEPSMKDARPMPPVFAIVVVPLPVRPDAPSKLNDPLGVPRLH